MISAWNKKIGLGLTIALVVIAGFFGAGHSANAEFTDETKERAQIKEIIDLENQAGATLSSQPSLINGTTNGSRVKLSEDGMTLLRTELVNKQDFLTTQQAQTLSVFFNIHKNPIFTTRAQQEIFERGTPAFKSRVLEVLRAPVGSTQRTAALEKYTDVGAVYPELVGAAADPNITTASESIETRKTSSSECTSWLTTTDNCIKSTLIHITGIIVWFVGVLLYFAAKCFDFMVNITVVHFADFISTKTGVGLAIDAIWRIGRDISNMFFIFLIVASAIGTILDVGKMSIKNNLAKILIVAVLINFSLPVTRVIIDASNIMATEFYTALGLEQTQSFTTFIVRSFAPPPGMGISCALGNMGNTPSAADSERCKPKPGELDYLTIIGNMVGAILVMFALAFTFFAGTALFFMRVVSLIFVMALSSLAFLTQLVPRTESYYGKWWGSLLDNSLFAPVYLFLLYFVFRIMMQVGTATLFVRNVTSQNYIVGIIPIDQPAALMFYYALILGLLNGATVIATTLSSDSWKRVEKNVNWMTDKFKAPILGVRNAAGNRLGRETLGRGARAFADREFVKNFASGAQGTTFGALGRGVNTVFGANATTAVRGTLQNVASQRFNQPGEEKEAKARLEEFKGDTARQLALLSQMERAVAQKVYDGFTPEEKIKIEKAAENTPQADLIKNLRTNFVANTKTEIDTGKPKTETDAKKEGELKKAEGTIAKEKFIENMSAKIVTDKDKEDMKAYKSSGALRGTARSKTAVKDTDQEYIYKMNRDELTKVFNGLVNRPDVEPAMALRAVINDLKPTQFKSFVMNINDIDGLDTRVIEGIRELYKKDALHEELAKPFLDKPATPGAINQARTNLGIDQDEPNH